MKNGREQHQSLLLPPEGYQDNHTSNYATIVDEEQQILNEDDKLLENGDPEPQTKEPEDMPLLTIVAILSTSFSYGCVLTTLFLITLPVECERINKDHPEIPESVALGVFVAIAGVTQLISPIVGRLSDTYVPPYVHEIGQRMPYFVFGSLCTVSGLLGQVLASCYGFWIRYGFAFFLHMIGLNIMYAMMLALLPDQVPHRQTGVANGFLALQLVTGSLFGFGLYHSFLSYRIQNMYALYTCIVVATSISTATHAHDRDAELTYERIDRRRRSLIPREDSNRAMSSPSAPKWKKAAKKAAKKAKRIVLAPSVILKTMFVDPFHRMDSQDLYQSYTIDRQKYHDFFVVTVSRLFYYCGMSVQTFFLYYLQDVIGVVDNPEGAVANLAILGQCTGALTCYPVGLMSDRLLGGRRKPFVYLACAILAGSTFALIWARTMEQMIILCLILGGANGIYLTMDTSLAVDTLPKKYDGNGDGAGSAQLLGIWGVAAFLGAALGPCIAGPLLYLVGQQKSDEPLLDTLEGNDHERQGYSVAGYAVILGLASFYFFCSAVTLGFIKDSHV